MEKKNPNNNQTHLHVRNASSYSRFHTLPTSRILDIGAEILLFSSLSGANSSSARQNVGKMWDGREGEGMRRKEREIGLRCLRACLFTCPCVESPGNWAPGVLLFPPHKQNPGLVMARTRAETWLKTPAPILFSPFCGSGSSWPPLWTLLESSGFHVRMSNQTCPEGKGRIRWRKELP